MSEHKEKAAELYSHLPPLLEEIERLFVSVRTLTEDSLALRNPELSMQGIRAGFSLNEAEAHLKRLQRGLRWTINGILPPYDGPLSDDEQEEQDDD